MLRFRRLLLMGTVAGAAVLLSAGCGRSAFSGDGGRTGDTALTASTSWQRTVDPETYRARLGRLTAALDRLRADTRSGWVGRQDDVTGFLTELTGGTFTGGTSDPEALAGELLQAHGPDLFGISPSDVRFVSSDGPSPQDPARTIVLRGEQRVGRTPVLDASLVVSVATSNEVARVRAVTGRVFPGTGVDTTPLLAQGAAEAVAEQVSGGRLSGSARLVVVPGRTPAAPDGGGGGGTLAWEIPVSGGTDGGGLGVSLYYVDAIRGTILSVRPGAADASVLRPIRAAPLLGAPRRRTGAASTDSSRKGSGAQPRKGDAVELSGTGPTGDQLTATGLRTPEGRILLIDPTTPGYDPTTGAGGIETHDATGLTNRTGGLPGPVASSETTTVTDSEALAAQALGRYVIDYYRTVHGRNSWDGRGGRLISSVHYGGFGYCNSFFDGEQMVFGTRCEGPNGAANMTEVEIDTAGHEITHGVTATSVGGSQLGLVYTGQSGAMNESFSDYFGNTIGNLMKGLDTAQVFEGSCIGISEPTSFCRLDPAGGLSYRYMLNGSRFGDYLYLLDPSYNLSRLGYGQDHGGVHLNSAIWNNVLWSIRTRLANMDNQSGNESPRARQFDAIVYAALTRHLSPTSGFLEGRTAVELAAGELGGDPEIIRVIRQQFDLDEICATCLPPPSTSTLVLAGGSQSEKLPAVAGARTAWLDLSSGAGATGFPTVLDGRGTPSQVAAVPDAFSVAFAGQAVIAAETPDGIVRYPPQGRRRVLSTIRPTVAGFQSLLFGVAGSDDGGAWADLSQGTVNFVDPEGEVTSASLEEFDGEAFVSIGTGGRTVVLGSLNGTIVAWMVGSDPVVVDRVPGRVLAVAAHGDAVAATVTRSFSGRGSVSLYRLGSTQEAGPSVQISDSAAPFGLAMSADHLVWPEVVGLLQGQVARSQGLVFPDTDLMRYGLLTGATTAIAPGTGQQGFPALSGTRLVWQDAGRAGDDIVEATLPRGP